MNVDQPTVSRIEKDRIVPPNELIEKWCAVTGNVKLFAPIICGKEHFNRMVLMEEAFEKVRKVLEFTG